MNTNHALDQSGPQRAADSFPVASQPIAVIDHDKVWYPFARSRSVRAIPALQKPLYWSRARHVRVATDIFSDDFTDSQRDRCFAVVALCPQHTFTFFAAQATSIEAWGARISWDRIIASCTGTDGVSVIHKHTLQALFEHFGPHPQRFTSLPKRNTWPLGNVFTSAAGT